MKFPLKWHEQSSINMRLSLKALENQLASVTEQVNKLRTDCLRYETQIKEANRQGRDGFDRDRFMQKRNRKDK